MSDQAPVLDPKRTALLVMDFQQDVLRRMPGLEPLVARVQGAIADMRDHGGTIGYVRVAFTEEDWAAIPPGNSVFAQAAQNRMMHHEDPSTAIHDSLAPQPGDIVVRKTIPAGDLKTVAASAVKDMHYVPGKDNVGREPVFTYIIIPFNLPADPAARKQITDACTLADFPNGYR